MKRREFLKLSGASVPALGLAACHGDSDSSDATTGGSTGAGAVSYAANDIRSTQAARIVSANGELSYEMNMEYAQFDVNGIGLNSRTFNGKFPPDTLVAKPGDTLKVKFKNSLPPSAEDHFHPTDVNIPHGFNNGNLHTHGLNASPASNEDNVLLVVHPGESFDYAIHIPEDHPSGTFWYHTHKHGSALHQLASGMSGFLMIEGGDDDLKKIPEIANAEEVDLSFHELIISLADDSLGEVPSEGVPGENLILDPDDPNYDPYARNPIYQLFQQTAYLQYTLNGKAVDEGANPATQTAGTPPEITLRPGELQRWNFGLLCHLQTYRFAIHNSDSTAAGIPLRVAAWDGITADELESHDELVLGPADRVDLLIKAPKTPGTYHLKMLSEQFGSADLEGSAGFANAIPYPIAFDDDGNPTDYAFAPAFVSPTAFTPELNILTIKVEGEVNDMALPASLNPPSKRLPYILDHEITRHRNIEFKVDGKVDFLTDPLTDSRKFFINNLHFSANRINETMLLGTAEEWTITNHHEEHQFLQINHPFHIHVNWFQVMEIHHHDGSIEKPNNGRGRWVDTIDVPFGGKTIIRHRFENYPGIFPMHCHIIAHEDEGMMHLCEVVDPTPISETILSAGGGTLMSREKRAFSTTADANGLLTVHEGDSRVKVAFPAGAFDQDALLTYAYQLDPEADPGTGASGETLIGLQRYFDIYSPDSATLNGEATVTIDYPSELSHGETYDADSVKLYRYDETQSSWTTDGITQVSKDHGLLVSTINNTALKSEYFAVLATQLTGPVTTPTTNDGGHLHV